MKAPKPFASISLDLDNQWSYMKTHGDPGWETYPSYLDVVVPRVLDFLRGWDVQITFFIVGKDAAIPKHREVLESIALAGHEIGNHSYHHDPWLHLYSEEQIETELALAEEHIERSTGYHPVGFRGPGYSLSPTTLRVLERRGYLYDASTLPTFLSPLARAYYFMTTTLTREEKHQRSQLFGKFSDGFRSLRPYRWLVENGGEYRELIEIPVTTMPFVKLPIHLSYVIYISKFSKRAAISYFKIAMALCRLSRIQPSLLLHPLDFLGCDDTKELSFFPAMGLQSEEKLSFVHQVIDTYIKHYKIFTLRQVAQHVGQSTKYRLAESVTGKKSIRLGLR